MLEVNATASSRQPLWLDADEQRIWFAFAYALIRLPSAMDAQMQADAGISQFEYLVLSGLSMAPEHTRRMSDLAVFTASSLSRLSNVVAKLETHGWIRRSADPTDGRCTLATLTELGRKKVVASAPGHVEEVRRLVFAPLTKAQQRALGRISERILQAMDPERPKADNGHL